MFEDLHHTLPPVPYMAPYPLQSIMLMPALQTLRTNTVTPILQQATLPTEVIWSAEVEVQTTTVPRTTAWHHRKRTSRSAVATLPLPQTQARRSTLTICGEPMASTGHSQFYGKQYCPNALGQIPKEKWLIQRRAEITGRSN